MLDHSCISFSFLFLSWWLTIVIWICSHSYGEFVFDHSWADAYYRYGSQYYPKLQSCVPFTPATGQRILVRNTWYRDQVFDMLVMALKDLTAKVSHKINARALSHVVCSSWSPWNITDKFTDSLWFWSAIYYYY